MMDFDSILETHESRAGLPKGLLRSIVTQETGGKAAYIEDPAKYHYELGPDGRRVAAHTGKVSTAFGPFGLLESTASRPGYGVAPLGGKDINEQARFAADYLAARIKQAGSVEAGLAGYGEGAKYAQRVLGRLAPAGKAAPSRVAVAGVGPKSAAAFGTAAVPTFADIADKQAAAQAEKEATTFGDALGTAFYDPRMNGAWALVEHMQKGDADESYDYWARPDRSEIEGRLQNLTELQFLRENSGSAEQTSWALDQINQRRDMDKVYTNAGNGASLGAALAVGIADPIGWAAGLVVGKPVQVLRTAHTAMKMSRARAASGALAEGAVGNVLFEAAQDALGEVRTLEDYVMAAGFGAAFGTLGVPGALRDAETQRVLDAGRRAADDMDSTAFAGKVASREAGETPEVAAVRQAEEINQHITAASRVGQGDDVAIPQDLAEGIREADEGVATDAPAAPQEGASTPATAVQSRAEPPTVPRGRASASAREEMRLAVEQLAADVGSGKVSPQERDRRIAESAKITDIDEDDVYAHEVLLGNYPTVDAARAAYAERRGAWVAAGEARDAVLRAQGLDELLPRLGAISPGDAATLEFTRNGASPRFAELVTQGYYRHKAEGAQPLGELKAPTNEQSMSALWGQDGVVTLRQALTDAQLSPAAAADMATRNLLAHLARELPPSVLDTTPVKFSGVFDGVYRTGKNEIETGGTDAKNLQREDHRGRNEANVLAHEAIHAATARIIQAIKDGKKVPEEAKQSLQRLEELRDELAKELHKRGILDRSRKGGANYAISKIEEFVAQGFNDFETRTILAEMPGRGYQADNGWGAFMRGVLGMLGFTNKKVHKNPALGEMMMHVRVLIDTQGKLPDDISFITQRSGSDLNAPHTLTALADRKFAERMYQHAASWLGTNPIDPVKLEVLAQQALPKGSAVRNYLLSDGLKLASSKNPILQMMSGLITEVTTGAAGRRTTAAVKRDMLHQKIVGHAVTDYHTAYGSWRARNGGSHVEDFRFGEKKREFDKLVTEEILHRRHGLPSSTDGAVVQAANAMQGLFQRSLDTQKQASTLGSGLLPPDAEGYLPQSLQGDALANASTAELEVLAHHFAKHWQAVYGWSSQFALPFSRTYIDRAKKRANGQDGIDFVATESPSAAVRDTLEEMRLQSKSLNSRARAELDRVGAQPQNKKRLDVDLLAVLPNGKRVMDYYSTDVEVLARQHANRVAGSAALADFNVLGQRGVNNILMSVDLAEPEFRALPEEREALARVFSEFLGQPVKGEYRSRWAANAGGFVRLQRLGGLAFTQFSEMANLTHHLGLGSLFKGIASLPSMVREVRTLKHGGTVNNPWLSSMEAHQGFEFGMDGFHLVARLDPPDELLRQYGKGNDVATRAIAGGNHIQAQLSFFRGLHAAQHRGVAELILKKAIAAIGDMQGNTIDSKMLADMGISPALARAIKADLPAAVQRDANGNAIGFDITKLSTVKAQQDLLTAIHRGTGQIIQRTFIGERGAWAHNDVTKLLLQLRTFGLTAMEKQWGRTRVINAGGPLNGYGYAAGVLLGQMAFAVPVYLARAQVYSAGRDDRDEFLDRATSPMSLLTASMNYSASSGLMGDAMDLVGSLGAGWNDDVKSALGVRSYGGGVGSVVPVLGSIDAAYRVVSGKADLHSALKQLPFSNLPTLAPIINLTASDD